MNENIKNDMVEKINSEEVNELAFDIIELLMDNNAIEAKLILCAALVKLSNVEISVDGQVSKVSIFDDVTGVSVSVDFIDPNVNIDPSKLN